ncbi:LPS-assembly protein LptD [Serratia symbiotica]|nr:LPS-assembly protein LptD [Serratia symbiotica]
MKKSSLILLATIFLTVLCTEYTLADQCVLGVHVYDKPLPTGYDENQLITINSDELHADYPTTELFIGNVKITKGNRTLTAKKVELRQIQNPGQSGSVRTVSAAGDVKYSDPQITLSGDNAWSNLNTKDTDVYKGEYEMLDHQGRGAANKIKIRGANRYTMMESGTFTSCLPGDDSWSVSGSKVVFDRTEQVAEVWNARLRIRGFPVFYSPYMQLPIGDKRRSGFLIPNAKYGTNNGLEFILPYYWNIAPNYDVTFTPHYMPQRGLQWQTEFRYLVAPGSGLVTLDWLPNDKEHNKYNTDNSNRALLHWKHAGVFDQVWRFNINFTKVSDAKYFTDLDSKYGSSSDGYATQKFSLGYANQHWNAIVSSKKFQILDRTDCSTYNSYKVMPQLDVNYYINNLGPFGFHLYGQIAKFNSIDPHSPDAIRWHLEPTLNLPVTKSWVSLNTEAKLWGSHYEQKIPNCFASNYINRNSTSHYTAIAPNLDNSINRLLPQFKADGKLVFERPMILWKGSTQTLEPRIQYLYVPYHDQSNIYIYDTTLLQTNYSGLFRDRTYTGLDRIAANNRVSSGVSTRIYDNALVERFNVSVGQIYHFNRSGAGDPESRYDSNDRTGSLLWVGDAYWKIDDRWSLRGGLQYDTSLKCISLSNAVLGYHQEAERIVQVHYRYVTPEYIHTALNTGQTHLCQHGIAQAGVTGSWLISDRLAVVCGYYYDARARQSANQLLGLKYSTCCWAVTLGYECKVTDWNKRNNTSIYDNKVSFNFELRGLSSDKSLSSAEMLRSGILRGHSSF